MSIHRCLSGLPGCLIPFDTQTFVPQCQKNIDKGLRRKAFLLVSLDFTPPLVITMSPILLMIFLWRVPKQLNLASHSFRKKSTYVPFTPSNDE